MYAKILNVQIMVSLLKQHNIRHIVLSAGTRHVPLAHSVENDDFFKCYSVVDERSAAYFAMGIAKETGEPVAIACTSSTATCNYLPGISEAYYQHIPLLVLTGDRDPYRLGQLEDQMIDQVDMYKNFCKKCYNLPIVNNDYDAWYCTRLVNEAIIELRRHGSGPVQINFPINQTIDDIADASVPELPEYNRIDRLDTSSPKQLWEDAANKLRQRKKIMIVCGSDAPAPKEQLEAMERFFNTYNCFISTEHLSNIHCDGVVNTYLTAEAITAAVLKEINPDLVIFFGGNFISRFKILLRNIKAGFESWLICDDGIVVDPFQNLTKVFECPRDYFFSRLAELGKGSKNDKVFYKEMKQLDESIRKEGFPKFLQKHQDVFCAFNVMRALAEHIPEHSLVHTSILNSTRIMQHFPMPKDVTFHSNVGTDGIDGSMSTFFGQASVTDRECYLVIGDLSFFYDMNSLGIRDLPKHTHILLINNGGGSEFYFSMGPKKLPNIDMHISAAHGKTAEAWVKASGFTYLSATSLEQAREQMAAFAKTGQEQPVLMEVFTDKLLDVETFKEFRRAIHIDTAKRTVAAGVVDAAEKIPAVKKLSDSKLGQQVKNTLKKFI